MLPRHIYTCICMYQYEDNDRGKGKGGVVTVTIRFVQDDLTKRAKCYCLSRSDTSITEKRTIPALENINHRVLNNSNEANNMFVLKQLKRCMCFTQHTCRKVFFVNKKKQCIQRATTLGIHIPKKKLHAMADESHTRCSIKTEKNDSSLSHKMERRPDRHTHLSLPLYFVYDAHTCRESTDKHTTPMSNALF